MALMLPCKCPWPPTPWTDITCVYHLSTWCHFMWPNLPGLSSLGTRLGIHVNISFSLQVESCHKSKSGFMEDFCDGKLFSVHPLFSVYCNVLQVWWT